MEFRLTPISQDLYGAYVEQRRSTMAVRFLQLPTGERYVHFSSRATRKTD
jgi:hypothetical protein